MTPTEALNLLDQAAAAARMSRQEHSLTLEAVATLAAFVSPQPASNNTSDTTA